ncbi:MAG: 30S ribosomal protein S5 [Candidatus Poseidoniaceae archaeon]|jgi:small subunit ribosomal protein S5|nr:30S ribosomal protein S5 [Candidatus Poseidoniaceae archaeon]
MSDEVSEPSEEVVGETPDMPVEVQDVEIDLSGLAPGLQLAFNPQEATEEVMPRRRRGAGQDSIAALRDWNPRTRLGRMVASGQVRSMEQALRTGLTIREVEIVDALLPNLEDDVLKVNMVQRMTDSGRRMRFSVMACVGNKDGYVGLAIAKGKEAATTISKAINRAKLNVIPVMRGNGSWESSSGGGRSIPLAVTGRSGSTRVTLSPAPSGKGLVIGEYGKRVLTLAGITDVISRSKGQTRTTINYAKATYNALAQLNKTRISDEQKERLFIAEGRLLE